MRKRSPYRPTVRAALGAALLAMSLSVGACHRQPQSSNDIYTCTDYQVTADSVISHELRIGAADIALPAATDSVPSFSSSAPIVDRIYAAGAGYASIDDTSLAPAGQMMEILFCRAITDPEGSITRLRNLLGPDSLPVTSSDGYAWPVGGGRALWVIAAWEAYCMTGSDEWLREAHAVAERTLSADMEVAYRDDIGLMQGAMITAGTHRRPTYPRWADATARFESMSLANNAISSRAFAILAMMREALSLDAGHAPEISSAIADAINDRLWIPSEGYYSEYLYGGAFPLQSPATDNVGQALAIAFGIPTPEMATMLLSRTPYVGGGPSRIYPSTVGTAPFNSRSAWPATQTAWAVAAALAGDTPATAFTVASLLKAAAGGNRKAAEAMTAVALRVIAGITPLPDRLEFHPMVITPGAAPLKIGGLRYRHSTLDIEIRGTGSRIARFAVDGVETPDYIISDTLRGRHSVEITLANNRLPDRPITPAPQQWLPPLPETDWVTPRRASIADHNPSAVYHLYMNGVEMETFTSKEINMRHIDRATSVAVTASAKNGIMSYSSRPRTLLPPGAMTTLQVEEFATPGTTLVRGRRPANRFVESSPQAVAVLTLELPEPEDGDCLIDLCYANGNGSPDGTATCAMRRLRVNGVECGTFVMPARGEGWWLSTAMSNQLRARLTAGTNIIEITTDGEAAPVLIDFARIIRLDYRKTPPR